MARRVLVLASVVLFAAPLIAAECVKVRTKAPHNPEASVWYHVPKGYDAARRKPYPVLVFFGGRNCTGKREASGSLKWNWACGDRPRRFAGTVPGDHT